MKYVRGTHDIQESMFDLKLLDCNSTQCYYWSTVDVHTLVVYRLVIPLMPSPVDKLTSDVLSEVGVMIPNMLGDIFIETMVLIHRLDHLLQETTIANHMRAFL